MPVPTAAQIKTQILTGSYPADTLHADNVHDYEQYVSRRRYPSCEILVVKPESFSETKKDTSVVFTFEIKYYQKNLGIRTDEVATIKSVEDAILATMASMTLQDHKTVLETRDWTRQAIQRDNSHPAYHVSTLRILVRQITVTLGTPDGVLTFTLSGSDVDNAPLADYIYSSVHDLEISEGYNSIHEFVTDATTGYKLPVPYAGNFSGTFICNIPVKVADLGSTGDKLNKLMTLKANGEKPIAKLTYTDKENKEVTPGTLTEVCYVSVDNIQRLYRVENNIIFRVVGRLERPSTITTS